MTLRDTLRALQLVLYALFLWVLLRPQGVPNPAALSDRYAWIAVTWLFGVPLVAIPAMRRRSLRTPIDGFLAAYVAVALVTWIWASDGAATGNELLALGGQVALFYGTVGVVGEHARAPQLVLAALVAGISLIQLEALNFHLTAGLLTRPIVYDRPTGWSGYPELSQLAVTQIAILAAWLHDARGWRTVAALAILLAVATVQLVLLYARMAWIAVALIAVLGIVLGWREGHRRAVTAVLSVLLIGASLLVWQNNTVRRLARGMVGLERSGVDATGVLLDMATPDMRLDIWRRTSAMIRDHSLTGVGLGNFTPVFESKYNPEVNNDGRRGGHAHSFWLQQASEVGVFGGVAILALWIAVVRTTWRQHRQSVAARALLFVIAPLAVRNIADNLFFSTAGASARLYSITWITFALAAAMASRAARAPTLTTPRRRETPPSARVPTSGADSDAPANR